MNIDVVIDDIFKRPEVFRADLSRWNISKVPDMSVMFRNDKKLVVNKDVPWEVAD